MLGRCLLCKEIKAVRYIDLYIIGSEGMDTCHECEMEVVAAVKAIMRQKSSQRVEAHRLARKTEQQRSRLSQVSE